MRRRASSRSRLAGDQAGEIAADDEVVDVFEQLFDAGISLVEVGNDDDAGFAGPAGGKGGGSGVVAVDVERAGVDDPFAVEVTGAGESGARRDGRAQCARRSVHEDERLRAAAAGHGDKLRLDTGAAKIRGDGARPRRHRPVCRRIAYACPSAGRRRRWWRPVRRGGGCASCTRSLSPLGKSGERNKCVGGVQSNADEVNFQFWHSKLISLQLVNGQAHLEAGRARLRLHA